MFHGGDFYTMTKGHIKLMYYIFNHMGEYLQAAVENNRTYDPTTLATIH